MRVHLFSPVVIFLLVFPLFKAGAQHSAVTRIAILACHRQNNPSPALARYLAMQPDLALWIGDNVYADTKDDITFIDACYNTLAAKPEFAELRKIDFLATWDDHDYGLNDAGKHYAIKAQSKDLFRRFWGLENEIPAERSGIYYARTLNAGGHTLQVIMLDVRYNRDDPGPQGDVLGEEQWAWLEQELRKPAELRLIVSGFQILLDGDSPSETWGKFPLAQERLFQLIRQTEAEGVVFITGDQHYGEVCRKPYALDFDAIELQFAGINQTEDPEFNSLRVSPVATSLHSYAMLDIQWEKSGADLPHLMFRLYDAETDDIELTYRVNFDEIRLKPSFTGRITFIDSSLVAIRHPYAGLSLRYTLDGSLPHSGSPVYTASRVLKDDTDLQVRFFDSKGNSRSRVFQQVYKKVSPLAGVEKPKNPNRGLRYTYYETAIQSLDEILTAKAKASGVTQDYNPSKLATIADHYAIVYEGLIEVSETGYHTFYSQSDDGSRVYVHGQLVVDNDGSHSRRLRSGEIALEKGLHPIRIEYFEDTEGQSLKLEVSGPDQVRRAISAADFYY